MTREEKQKAIDALKKSVPIMAMTPNEFDDYIQTLNKIADFLTQEPCEDCISREQALRIAELSISEGYGWQKMQLSILPSVQPKPRKGKWIPLYDDDGTHTYEEYYAAVYQCPFCGIKDIKNNFCPNCGADMRESEG